MDNFKVLLKKIIKKNVCMYVCMCRGVFLGYKEGGIEVRLLGEMTLT